MKEKREYVRLKEPIVVKYRTIGSSCIREKAIGRDISQGGIWFSTRERFEKGTGLDLEIILPFDPMSIFAQGQVAWIRKKEKKNDIYFLIGLRFTSLEDYDKKRIFNYIKYRLHEEDE